MSRIIPIPSSRVGDLFIRQRLVDQVQYDQLSLFRLQTQVSTGRRLLLPSDDAPAALRAINVQRLLDRKDQIRTNLQASNSYLSAASDRLSSISNILSDLRGEVVAVSGTVVPESARQAVIQEVEGVLRELVNAGNAKYQGRYLFAGSRSQAQPYGFSGDFVEFFGNDGLLRSYVDLEQLFETNLSGIDVFGGVSAAVEGAADLNPHLTRNTLVSTLNGGSGIGANPAISLSVNNGTTTAKSTIDLSGAVTIGDVARLIEIGAPAGTTVKAEVTSTGLVVRTVGDSDGDPIIIGEVGQGRTARQLGFPPYAGPATDTLVGQDLNPAVLKTTRLANLLGTKAQGVIESDGNNNDIVLTAAENGAQFNGVTINFVDDVSTGNEFAVYTAGTNTLTVHKSTISSANEVAAAITEEGTFIATIDYHDANSSIQAGTGTLGPILSAQIAGGSGEVLDTENGLVLTNGGQTVTLDISGAETVEDLLNLINGAGLGLAAEINSAKNGINVRSRLSGADFTIGENGGTTATQLGIRTYTGATELSMLNRGSGVETTSVNEQLDTSKLDDLRIVARNGVVLDVDLSGAASLQAVVDRINSATGNNVVGDPVTGTTRVVARLATNGNAVELVDSSTTSTDTISGSLRVEVFPPGSQAPAYLGFVSPGETQNGSTLAGADGSYVMSGQNVLGNDMLIVARDGTELWIDLAGTKTVQDVIDRINNNPNAGAGSVTARLARVGNGIELVDGSGGAGTLTVRSVQGSLAAEHLGFVAPGAAESDSSNVQQVGGNQFLKSADRNTFEADSVFNTLLRLKTALEQNDNAAITASLDRLDVDMDRVNFARAELGARLQNLEFIDLRMQDENVQLRSALSNDLDADLVQAISDLTARQYAFEASLRTTASMMQMSLLNFL